MRHMPLAFAATLFACGAAPLQAEIEAPPPRLDDLDRVIEFLRCNERPTIERRAECYADAARLLENIERLKRQQDPPGQTRT
jgi:hypothetical protein